MSGINDFDKLLTEKVYKKCIDKGITKYSDIAIILNTSDSFVKAVFSAYRKKLNLYHLLRLSYELGCSINDFIPTSNDYEKTYGKTLGNSEKEMFLYCIAKEDLND